jgi:hypothetical protein
MNDQPKTIRPRFYKEATLNEARTKAEGRPIYDDVEYVEVNYPGDRLQRLVRLADDPISNGGPSYAKLYPDYYAAFKRGESRAVSGTPLEAWPILTTASVAELKASNILSVDELAEVSDGNIGKLGPGARDLREQARAFLDSAKGGANVAAMAQEISNLKKMVEALTQGIGAPPSVSASEMQTVDINDATDEQLKQFIKEQTGAAPRGNPSRETLLARVAELAQPQEAA